MQIDKLTNKNKKRYKSKSTNQQIKTIKRINANQQMKASKERKNIIIEFE